ncbi:glycosyltransferase family 1 protein [Methanococcus maripaludis]|uniref:glycosyltransferase family 4 protein n=1 Tax=Methanococcus maripaludis TaxID=39152 RepID=UPI0031412621
MKIGIIADRLNRPLTGIGNYIYNLITEISISNKNIYIINYEENKIVPNVNKITIKNPVSRISNKSFYFWHLYLNYYLKKTNLDLDIIHSPENATPFTTIRSKKVITVYDDIPFHFPEYFTKSTRYRHELLLQKTLNSSDKIISISENTKRDVINHFKIPEDKIKVIPLAANENFKKVDENETSKIKSKYNINFPFILYVGTLEPRKNIPSLLNAFYIIKKQGIPHKLVIAGGKGWKYKEIFETIDKLNLQNDVIFTGYVPDEDLPGLYNAADLFVYPSLYEGFGLPPLEAMQCGTPVITSNTSSLPEVVGDAGIMINPYDVDELANKMYEVLTNEKLRKEMSKKGLERAKLFSWKKCAEEHLKVYEEVLGR